MCGQLYTLPDTVGLLPLVWVILGMAWLAYVCGTVRMRRQHRYWPAARTASFAVGLALIALAAVPTLDATGQPTLQGHMTHHLLLGMFAPIALVLGTPMTLLLKSVRKPAAKRLTAFLAHRPVRFLIHPLTAGVMDIGAMYLLYLTPLYVYSTQHLGLHVLVHIHFVVWGYVFTWSVIGTDPAPRRPSGTMRLAALLLAAATHATLAKLMYAYGFPQAAGYDILDLAAGAKLMYYGGDVAEVVLAIVFFSSWFRSRRSRSFREEDVDVASTPSCAATVGMEPTTGHGRTARG